MKKTLLSLSFVFAFFLIGCGSDYELTVYVDIYSDPSVQTYITADVYEFVIFDAQYGTTLYSKEYDGLEDSVSFSVSQDITGYNLQPQINVYKGDLITPALVGTLSYSSSPDYDATIGTFSMLSGELIEIRIGFN